MNSGIYGNCYTVVSKSPLRSERVCPRYMLISTVLTKIQRTYHTYTVILQ